MGWDNTKPGKLNPERYGLIGVLETIEKTIQELRYKKSGLDKDEDTHQHLINQLDFQID